MSGSKWLGACAGLALACSMSSPVMAQQSGFYVGGSLGQSEASGFCSDLRSVFTGVSACDEKDTGFKIFAGYQVNRNFAIEGSYVDYGEFTARATVPPGVLVTGSADATAFGVAGLGILPVSDRFSLFGKVGLLMTDIGATVSGGGVTVSESDDETGLQFGVGVLFNFTNNIGIRAEWERNDEAEIDMLSAGIQVRF